jgi:hypothetical protein
VKNAATSMELSSESLPIKKFLFFGFFHFELGLCFFFLVRAFSALGKVFAIVPDKRHSKECFVATFFVE